MNEQLARQLQTLIKLIEENGSGPWMDGVLFGLQVAEVMNESLDPRTLTLEEIVNAAEKRSLKS